MAIEKFSDIDITHLIRRVLYLETLVEKSIYIIVKMSGLAKNHPLSKLHAIYVDRCNKIIEADVKNLVCIFADINNNDAPIILVPGEKGHAERVASVLEALKESEEEVL